MRLSYKRENEHEWRGPAKEAGVSGPTVVVQHGDSLTPTYIVHKKPIFLSTAGLQGLREIARVHVTRIQSRSLEKEERTEANNHCPMKAETSVAEEGNMGLNTQGEGEMMMGWRERKEVEDEGERKEVEEREEED